MSLILEALKKSEAERRRGQSPDLFGATLGTPPPRREIPRVWPLLLLGLILLASAWMIWSGGSRGESVAPADAPATADGVHSESDANLAPPPVRVTPAPAPAPAPARPAPPPADARPSAKPAQVETPPIPAAFAPAADVAAEAQAPAEEALPPLSVLDATSRAALPPLKLSMHVYAEDPGKRFAIIDGQRITEGALLGPGVVEAIRRDGVVLNVNGRRLLLPKP